VPDGDMYPYVALIIVLDDEVKTISRSLMTLAEALSNTGGIMGFIFVSFNIMIAKF
jgi:hypothetical protein